MKKRRTLLLITLIAVAALAITSILPAKMTKAEEEGYTYTVRIYAGKEGSFQAAQTSKNGIAGSVEKGGAVIVYTDVKPDDVIAFDPSAVQLNDGSKYYVKGIRESGKDNYDPEHPQLSAITVKGDEDYVVAYAMLGSSVAYTVNYVDANGNALSPAQTFYGNVGDKPVIAYRYVEGYFPQAYNLTGVLSANAADNVFTFVYQSVATREIQGEGGADAAGAGAAMQGTGLAGGALPEDQNGTQQLIDINNGAVPQANGGSGKEEQTTPSDIPDNQTPTAHGGRTFTWVIAGIGIAAAIALIIALIVAMLKRKKKNDDQEN